ncbi:MAG: GGDEF domain-containing protein [Thermoleophilia bacterium]|nr:GGDEF domain-containing protein [Thermoleophilia bacterium]
MNAMVMFCVATFVIPILVIGGSRYPPSEWKRAFLWALLLAGTGLTVQRLVREISQRGELQKIVTMAARTISSKGDSRNEICAAMSVITGTDLVMLFEPDHEDPGVMVVTASHGTDIVGITVSLSGSESSGAVQSFIYGKTRYVIDARDDSAVSSRLVELTGVRSVLFQPIFRAGRTVGTIVIGWSSCIKEQPSWILSGIELLASEIATSIDRADLLARERQLARTDHLTRLANRRVWDEELPIAMARAARSSCPLTLAMIDIDHFKLYNDEHGHQAGDELLQSCAAAWSGFIRKGDLLARYGGEEFVIAFFDTNIDQAEKTVDRLRAETPGGASVSIGLAATNGDEDIPRLMKRADTALYQAKSRGRDRVERAKPQSLV